MKKVIKYFLFLFLAGFAGYNSWGQQVISPAGNSGVLSGYHIDWTLGEPVIETLTGANHTLTQGIHQTRLKITPIDEISMGTQRISVYPNPVELILNIGISNQENTKFSYRLTDLSGKKLLHRKINSDTEQVDMKDFASGVYVLQVLKHQHISVQSFKIIKD